MPKSTIRKLTSVAKASGILAIGEGTARVCTMLALILVSRKFGVSTLGSLALAQTLGIYIALGIDSGSRHIGAKLIAAHPGNLRITQSRIQRKRLLLALLAIPLGFLYAIGVLVMRRRWYLFTPSSLLLTACPSTGSCGARSVTAHCPPLEH